jgi:hypothetical protein
MKKVFSLVFAIAALAGATPASAQGTLPIALELRLDGAWPMGDFHDAFDTGVGWGVQGNFDLSPAFTFYAGYSRAEFPIDGAEDTRVRDDGFNLGGRATLGSGVTMWTPFLQVGVSLHDETGIEGGLGADFPVSAAVGVTPLVLFRKVGDAEYVTFGLGLRHRP